MLICYLSGDFQRAVEFNPKVSNCGTQMIVADQQRPALQPRDNSALSNFHADDTSARAPICRLAYLISIRSMFFFRKTSPGKICLARAQNVVTAKASTDWLSHHWH